MQLKDLYKPLSELTEEELKERIQAIRHNRTVERPAAKARTTRAAKVGKKGTTTRMNQLHAMLASMSDEDKKELLASLGIDENQQQLPLGD